MKNFKLIQLVTLLLAVILFGAACLSVGNPVVQAYTDPAQTPALQEKEAPLTWLTLPEEYQLTGRNYFVYHVNSQQFVVRSNVETTRVYPASITKLFTIYVALQYVTTETKVTVGEEIKMIDPDSTVAGLQVGDVVTVEQLIGGLLLPSGNDAAYAMAAAVGRVISGAPSMEGGEAVQVFVKEMNRKAQQLGMKGSHFGNPDGIHQADHYFSLEDMAMLGQLALQTPQIMAYAQQSSVTTTMNGRVKRWENTNKLLHESGEFYCPYSIGLKTGRTNAAGNCLLSAFQKDDQIWVVGVYGCPEGADRFEDTIHLFNRALSYWEGTVDVKTYIQ